MAVRSDVLLVGRATDAGGPLTTVVPSGETWRITGITVSNDTAITKIVTVYTDDGTGSVVPLVRQALTTGATVTVASTWCLTPGMVLGLVGAGTTYDVAVIASGSRLIGVAP